MDDESKSNRYEKIITISQCECQIDKYNQILIESALKLMIFMFNDAKLKNEFVEYFKLRLKDSEKSVNCKDLHLEWVAWK